MDHIKEKIPIKYLANQILSEVKDVYPNSYKRIFVYYLTFNLSFIYILTKSYFEFRLPLVYSLIFVIFYLAFIVLEAFWKTVKN